MFDEPSSYLDVKQRLKAARMIRSLIKHDNYVVVVEHDLAILDYLSDFTCCLYGVPGGYGVVTMPYGVREGINVFLAGFIPTENMRFRDHELNFKVAATHKKQGDEDDEQFNPIDYAYPALSKTLGPFHLKVEPGQFKQSEIVVLLGENGTGKSTFIHKLAGVMKPDDDSEDIPEMRISIKPQKIAPKFERSVRELFNLKLKRSW